jgi:pimeloyl-ACP methyl ester carboxylesterase
MKKIFKILGLVLLAISTVVLITLIIFYKADIPSEENEKKYFTAESEYIEINENRIHIRKKGSGFPILLIHGSFSSLHTWEVWQEIFSDDYTTISVDLPGHGLTGSNAQKRYDTDFNASLMWKLMEKLGYDTLAIAGNSMGGQVAYKMALLRPEKVKNLILINSSGARSVNDSAVSKNENTFSVFSLINHPLLSKLLTSITPKFLFEKSLKQVYYDESKITKEKIQQYYDLMLHEGNRQATMRRFQQRSPAKFEELENLKCSSLVIWGKHDRWIPVSHAYRFHAILQNSILKIYDNAGHVPMEEIPYESAQDAVDFLKASS